MLGKLCQFYEINWVRNLKGSMTVVSSAEPAKLLKLSLGSFKGHLMGTFKYFSTIIMKNSHVKRNKTLPSYEIDLIFFCETNLEQNANVAVTCSRDM